MAPSSNRMLSRYILRMADFGSRTAFIEQGLYRSRRFTYAQVIERSTAFSAWLESSHLDGSKCADPPRILIWAKPSARWAMAFYGCVLSGSVVVPVDAGFSADFVARVVRQTQAALLITDSETEQAIEKLSLTLKRFDLDEIEHLPRESPAPSNLPDDPSRIAEIVFTSGTTSQPRGVIITHGNLLANLEPVEKEIKRYWKLSQPFRPFRFLDLIPLSHLFGQVMGLFMPQLLQGVVIFSEAQGPAQLARVTRERRVSVVVCVPQQLEALGAWATAELDGRQPQSGAAEKSNPLADIERAATERWSVTRRWWHFRRVHQKLGWKMWAFVVGGARLPARVESLWRSLGYAVIQGYGLTETAPAITITHPFKSRQGAVGRPLPGAKAKIAADGEILVRGANVSPGYFGDPEATQAVFSDGWLHTGDLGRFDEEGNLIFLGRKKEVIVTAEGLNVFPEDVERALAAQPAIQDVAVVGKETRDGATASRTLVYAVIVPAAGADVRQIESSVEQANRSLELHQRIRGFSLWPERQLPRTASTGKIRRSALAAWVNSSSAAPPADIAQRRPAGWRDFLQSLGVPAERIRPGARLAEDLGLSSLDRVELITWIESQGYAIDEESVVQAETVAEVDAALERLETTSRTDTAEGPAKPREAPAPHSGGFSVKRLYKEPKWPVSWPARALRALFQWLVAFPLLRYYIRLNRVDAEKLDAAPSPAIFICNHQSFFDAPLIFRGLPPRFRRRIAPAMSEEEFRKHNSFWLFLTRIVFNGYLISSNPARAQEALRHAGWLAERGFSTLIFPEGDRSLDGKLQRFRTGVGVMAERLKLPVIAVRLDGVFELWPRQQFWPRHGKARIVFGDTFRLDRGESPADFTARLKSYFHDWK